MSSLRFSFIAAIAAVTTLSTGFQSRRASATEWPAVDDVVRRLRTEWPEAPSPNDQQTNAEMYVASLAPRVLPGDAARIAGPLIARTNLYGGSAGYVRVGTVGPGLREALRTALAALVTTNVLNGTVLDLRSAVGTDYPAAAEAAGFFASRAVEGLKLGAVSLPVAPNDHPPAGPVIVLVNRETRGAAEALAAAVRAAASPSLLVGTNTAGQARVYRELNLSGGASLQVAGDALLLPGGLGITDTGIAPDLAVAVQREDEAYYLTNEFSRVVDGRPSGFTSSVATLRLNEAELVRRRGLRHSDDTGDDPGAGAGTRRSLRPRAEPFEIPPQPVADPVLARAIDLIDGWSKPVPPGEGDSR